MSYEQDNRPHGGQDFTTDQDDTFESDGRAKKPNNRNRDEVYSRRVPAGKRTYFFDVKSTRSGEDFFVTITESKRIDEGRYEKHKIFLYKEDFGKFVSAMHDVILHIKDDRLPDYDFRGLPELEAESSDAPVSSGSNGVSEYSETTADGEAHKEV